MEQTEELGEIPTENEGISESALFSNDLFENLENIVYLEWRAVEAKGETIFTPRTGHNVVCIEDQLYLFSGADNDNILNDIYVYDIFLRKWEKLNTTGSPPCPRSGSKGVVFNRCIYYFGGYTQKNGEYFKEFHIFDTRDSNWKVWNLGGERIPPRVDHSLVTYEKYIYVFGGSDGKTMFNDLYRINIEKSISVKIGADGQIPLPRFGQTADCYKNSMYVFGGWNGFDTVDELYRYSFVSNIWYEEHFIGGKKPPARYRHASVVLRNSLFIFGGVDKSQKRFNDLYEFSFDRREWKLVEVTGLVPSPRTFHQLVGHDDFIYLIGGSDGKKRNDIHKIAIMPESNSDFDNTTTSFFSLENKILFIEKNDKQFTLNNHNKLVKILREQISELSDRLNTELDRNTCKVCNMNEINAVFLECGHRFGCYNCSSTFMQCPLCKKKPSSIIKIFLV